VQDLSSEVAGADCGKKAYIYLSCYVLLWIMLLSLRFWVSECRLISSILVSIILNNQKPILSSRTSATTNNHKGRIYSIKVHKLPKLSSHMRVRITRNSNNSWCEVAQKRVVLQRKTPVNEVNKYRPSSKTQQHAYRKAERNKKSHLLRVKGKDKIVPVLN
jgi:hypothetical protein